MSATTLACPACQAELLPEDRYCEGCGAWVGAEEPCAESCRGCGAPAEAIAVDGYCSRCGVRQRCPDDRQAVDLVFAAGVSDRGCVHSRNEDALHLEAIGEGAVAVVCDGISSSASPHIAARRAAAAAGGVLTAALRGSTALDDATTSAIDAAQQAVLGAPWASQSGLDAPACTLVSAVCSDGELAIGWAGDSRAYWLAPEGSHQLTVDDSWAQEQVECGSLSPEEAGADPRAHSITRWLGADAPAGSPHLLTIHPNGPGRLVLCSDGLWNYTPSADEIAALIGALPPGAAPLAAAHLLADTALAAGGRDNITVVVIDVHQPPPRGDHR